jgi:DNA replication protein DnaC
VSAVLWKFVHVFGKDDPKRELEGSERDAAAMHLARINKFSTTKSTDKAELAEIEKTARESFSEIEKLSFVDGRDPTKPVEMHWIDVVFRLGRKLDRDDFLRMNLPEEFWKKFKVPEEVSEPLHEYVKKHEELMRDGIGIYLYGPTGRGKTTAAAELAKAIRSLSHTVFFVTVSDLREMIRSRIEFSDDQSAMERCKQVDFLVLDNLTAIEDTKSPFLGASALEDLLRFRVSAKRPTVITSQMGLSALRTAFEGLSFASIAQGACIFLPLTGKDLRSSAQAELSKRLGLGPKGSS